MKSELSKSRKSKDKSQSVSKRSGFSKNSKLSKGSALWFLEIKIIILRMINLAKKNNIILISIM